MSKWEHLDATRETDLFFPIGPEPKAPAYLRGVESATAGLRIEDFKCSSPPTSISQSGNYYRTIDTDMAAKLRISYIGTGNAELDRKMKVYVREFRKFSECESDNGQAMLRYGAVWRATALIDASETSGDINFPIVAASATLKRQSVQVSIEAIGFDPVDQVGIDRASQEAMKATKGGLTVETFAEFATALEKAVDAAIGAKVAMPPARIGFELRRSAELSESVARTFAIACAADGVGVQDAIARFPVKNAAIEGAIREAYGKLKEQNEADEISQLKARHMIEGIRIPLREWYQVWR